MYHVFSIVAMVRGCIGFACCPLSMCYDLEVVVVVVLQVVSVVVSLSDSSCWVVPSLESGPR